MQKENLVIAGVAVAAVLTGIGVYAFTASPKDVTSPAPTATSTDSGAPQAQPQAVTFRVLDSGANAADVSARKNYAAYSSESFKKIWDMAKGGGTVPPATVDFEKEYVIAVFAGEKPTGGYAISVSSVTDLGDTRTIAATISKPGAGCMTTQALTSPYQIIVVPKSTAELAAKDTEVPVSCD